MNLKRNAKNLVKKVGNILLIDILLYRRSGSFNTGEKCLINIGAGDWNCKGWICLDHSSGNYAKVQKGRKYIEYDIRSDNLPFDDNTVDAIYCSHVIEHIEDVHVYHLFEEVYRVLKSGGVFRIACPDAEYLWNVTRKTNDYWTWRKKWCQKAHIDFRRMRPVDFLVREVATTKLLAYLNSEIEDYYEEFEKMGMYEFFEFMKKDVSFDEKYTGNHINYWTFDKVREGMKNAGFNIIYLSKYAGSVSDYMKNKMYFDNTFPEMSLYVETIKQ